RSPTQSVWAITCCSDYREQESTRSRLCRSQSSAAPDAHSPPPSGETRHVTGALSDMDAALAYLSPIASHFQGLIDFVGSHPHFAVGGVFLLALAEALRVVGPVVPGSTTIIGISALATTADINPWLLLAAATAGAIAGDGISFWLGQHYK